MALERLLGVAGVFEGQPRILQKQTLLGVHCGGLGRMVLCGLGSILCLFEVEGASSASTNVGSGSVLLPTTCDNV